MNQFQHLKHIVCFQITRRSYILATQKAAQRCGWASKQLENETQQSCSAITAETKVAAAPCRVLVLIENCRIP
jgi:hypothetical protein